MEMNREAEVYLHALLTFAVDWSELSSSLPGILISGQEAPAIVWIECWVILRTIWALWRKEESLVPYRNRLSNP
jgi:hypothetical protein